MIVIASILVAVLGLPALDTPKLLPSAFCSVSTEDGRRYQPTLETTYSIVPAADVIVRAVAERVIPSPTADSSAHHPGHSMGWLEFRVLEVLKGEEVPKTLSIQGRLTETDDFNPESVPYVWARLEGQRGDCFAYRHRRGGEFLLLLKARDGRYTPYWSVFSPTNEQVRGSDDPWVQWVRSQIEAPTLRSELPPA